MSEIPNRLRADIMRKRMLDKNTLSSAGSLYMGTGELEVGTEQDDDRNKVYKVTRLPKGENNQILICKRQNTVSSDNVNSVVSLPEWASYGDIQWTLAKVTNNNDFNTLTGFSRESKRIEGTEKFGITVSELKRTGYTHIFVWCDARTDSSSFHYTFVPGLIALRDLPSSDDDPVVNKKYFFKYRTTNYICTISCSVQNGETTINFAIDNAKVQTVYALCV